MESQWPSLALLFDRRNNIQCTANIISPMWVLATYSCVAGTKPHVPIIPKDWTLYAGKTNFSNNADNSTTQVRIVNDIIAHPQVRVQAIYIIIYYI